LLFFGRVLVRQGDVPPRLSSSRSAGYFRTNPTTNAPLSSTPPKTSARRRRARRARVMAGRRAHLRPPFPMLATLSLVPLLVFMMVRYVSLRLYLRN
jgi:hypothetical protein